MSALSHDAVVRTLRSAGCVFAEDEASLLLAESWPASQLAQAIGRRVAGEPLEHILGWVAFGGLRILLDPGVFVPRRRTELLADTAAGLAAGLQRPVVVDLCCGSGAVAAVVLAAAPDAQLHAADIDPVEVACAVRNLGPRAVVGDLFDPLPPGLRGAVDILVANVPYVPTAEVALMPGEAREFEPLVALDGGRDGLDIARRVAAQAPTWLRPGGHLLIETSDAQVAELARVLRGAGLGCRIARREEVGAVIVVGTAPVSAARGRS